MRNSQLSDRIPVITKRKRKKKEEVGSDDALGRTDVEESTSGAIQ